MLGFLIGTACLIGLFKVARGGRRHWGYGGYAPWFAHHGYRGGCGGDGGEGYDVDPRGGYGRWRGGWGRSFFLRALFERLDTSPGQEKAIRAALDELRAATRSVREEMNGARVDVARVIRGDRVDDETLGEVSAKATAAAESMRSATAGALGKIHDALDERQRNMLADLIESGPGGFGRFGGWNRRGGPYRGAPAT
jgi:hypothetical protein